MKNILILIAGALIGFAICHFIMREMTEKSNKEGKGINEMPNEQREDDTITTISAETIAESTGLGSVRTSDNDEGTGVRIAESRFAVATQEFFSISGDLKDGISNAGLEIKFSTKYVLGINEVLDLMRDIDLVNKNTTSSDDSIRGIQINLAISPNDMSDTDSTDIDGYIDLVLVPVTGSGEQVKSSTFVGYSNIKDHTLNAFEQNRVNEYIADGITNSLILNCAQPCPDMCE